MTDSVAAAAAGGWAVALALALGLVPLLFIGGYVYTWKLYSTRNAKGAKVPMGSPWMLPFIGETVHLVVSSPPSKFFDWRYKKYGGMFTTSLFGSPTVVAGKPDAQKFFLTSRVFELKLTPNFQRIFGRHGIAQIEGEDHKRLRGLMLSIVGQNCLPKLVSPLDELAMDHVKSFQDGTVIESVEAMLKITFSITALLVSGYLTPHNPLTDEFRHAMHLMGEGWTSVDQIGLPGGSFSRALRGRQTSLRILDEVIAERRKTGGVHHDLIQALLDTKDSDEPLSDEQIKDGVLGFVFGAYHTSALSMTWLLKFLSENPEILQKVVEEQDRIAARKAPGELLTQADLKEMTLSLKVVLETLRLASFVPFTMREAKEDTEFDGYFIPKGWKVVVDLRRPHFETDTYRDPTKFDPFRFENPPKPGTYIPFGGGRRLCIGNDFAKQELLILMHRLFTQFKYEPPQQRGIDYFPLSVPKGGYIIKLQKRQRT